MAVLQGVSAFFAGLAALAWLVSALVRTPANFVIYVVRPTGQAVHDPLGGTYMGHAYSEDLNELARKLRLQSKWSAAAASCAAVSAALQAVSLGLVLWA